MKSSNRALRLVGVLGLVVLVGSAVGARWAMNSTSADGAADNAVPPPDRGVVCFGHVDVEHGVTSLYPLHPGRVTEVLVKETATVAKDTVLLRLDDALARQRVQEAEADLEAARAQLEQARKLPQQQQERVAQQQAAIEAVGRKRDAARHLLTRKQNLLKAQQINAEEVNAAAAQVEEVEAVVKAEQARLRELELLDPQIGVRRADADVKAKEARLEQAKKALDECALRAPTDGSVLRVLVGPGEVLGAQATKPAVLFCPQGPRLIRAEVEQEFANRVRAGYPATIQDDTTIPGDPWKGKVVRVSDWYTHRRSILQEPLQFNDVRTLECIIALEPDRRPLRIGQRVRVTIGHLPR